MQDIFWWLSVFFGIIACVGVLVWIVTRDKSKLVRWERDVRARPPVSEQEFESRFFRCQQIPTELAFRIRMVFAELTDIPVEQILPDEDFQSYINDCEEEWIERLEQEFGITFSDDAAAKMRGTIRSVAMAVAEMHNPRQI